MPRKSKGIYRQNYNDADLAAAKRAVIDDGMSKRQAAKFFKIPRQTLCDHLSGKTNINKPHGRPPALPLEVEAEVVRNVLDCAEKGFPLSRRGVLHKVGQVAHQLKIKTPFKDGKPGLEYWRGLKKRHKELTVKSAEGMQATRISAMNRESVSAYFQELGGLLKENYLQHRPHLIWNCDETNMQFSHKPSKVVARKGQSVIARTSNSKQSHTVLACVNAAGVAMPPFCVVKGKTEAAVRSYAVEDAPAGTYWSWQEKAWMTELLGDEWFSNVFLKNCGPERPQLLILDSHNSHECVNLLLKAREENIILLAFPPHTTSLLQPLDRAIFKPFKTHYSTICTEFMSRAPNNTIDKKTWPGLFKLAWEAKPLIIKSFQACGIYPFDPNVMEKIEAHFRPAEAMSRLLSSSPPTTPCSIPSPTPSFEPSVDRSFSLDEPPSFQSLVESFSPDELGLRPYIPSANAVWTATSTTTSKDSPSNPNPTPASEEPLTMETLPPLTLEELDTVSPEGSNIDILELAMLSNGIQTEEHSGIFFFAFFFSFFYILNQKFFCSN